MFGLEQNPSSASEAIGTNLANFPDSTSGLRALVYP